MREEEKSALELVWCFVKLTSAVFSISNSLFHSQKSLQKPVYTLSYFTFSYNRIIVEVAGIPTRLRLSIRQTWGQSCMTVVGIRQRSLNLSLWCVCNTTVATNNNVRKWDPPNHQSKLYE